MVFMFKILGWISDSCKSYYPMHASGCGVYAFLWVIYIYIYILCIWGYYYKADTFKYRRNRILLHLLHAYVHRLNSYIFWNGTYVAWTRSHKQITYNMFSLHAYGNLWHLWTIRISWGSMAPSNSKLDRMSHALWVSIVYWRVTLYAHTYALGLAACA